MNIITMMSQYHQAMLVSLVAILMTMLTRKIFVKVIPQHPFIYQIIAIVWTIVLEIILDIVLCLNYVVLLNPECFMQELITIICGMTMTMVIYETLKKVINNAKDFMLKHKKEEKIYPQGE